MSTHDADEENRDDLEVVDLTEHIDNQILSSDSSHTNFHISNDNSNDHRDQNQMEVNEAYAVETAPVVQAATETNEAGQEDEPLDNEDAPRGIADSDMGWLDNYDQDNGSDTDMGSDNTIDHNPFPDDVHAHSDEEDDVWRSECRETCRKKWVNLHLKSQFRKCRLAEAIDLLVQLQESNKKLHRKINGKNRKIGELEAEIERLRGRRGLHTEITWQIHLRNFILGNINVLPFGLGTYEKLYKLCCRESNIAPHPRQVLPGLELVAPDLSPQAAVQHVAALQEFNFEGLPLKTQFKILQHLLCFYGKKIHVLSRLDPYQPPALENSEEDPRLLYRFHIGDAPVNLTHATLPNALLAPLLVCKKLHFWGSYLFYGENTFAFSSLGE